MEENDDYQFKIWRRDDGIIVIKTGEKKWIEKDALRFKKELFEILDKIEGKAKILGDATEAGFGPTTAARKIYAEIIKSPKIGKAAIFGLSKPNQVIVSFLLNVTGKKDLKVFQTEEEALRWLKEDSVSQ
jgi:hypothetical protein